MVQNVNKDMESKEKLRETFTNVNKYKKKNQEIPWFSK